MAVAISFVEVFLAAGAFLLALFFLRGRNKRDPRYPPGPPRLPLIGNLHQIVVGRKPQQQFWQWAEQYGAAYSINMAGDDFIHINDPKLAKEVFSDLRSGGRSKHPAFLEFGQGNHGLIMAEGHHWQEQRRFTLRTLRDLGFAKTSMEGLIIEEVTGMLKWFEKRLGTPIRGDRIFNGPVVNSLWRIMSGERYEWDVPEKPELIERTERLIGRFNNLVDTGLMFFPALRHIPQAARALGWTDYVKSVADLVDTSNKSTEKHKAKLDPDNPGDLIDQFLIEINKSNDPKSSFYKETGEKNLTALIADLFLAGSETTSHSLSFSLLLLGHHPKVQQKLQAQLDSVLGRDRQPSLADKASLPYLEAVIMEVMRRTSVAANGVPHRMVEDAVFGGYFFPKGTGVMGNIYRMHHDPKIWGDPKNFRPERFLSPDGKTIVKNEALQPFSVGKRQCIGNTLAEDTLFLFIASIFQKFDVKPDPAGRGKELETIDPSAKILNETEPFKVIVSSRHEE